MKNIAIVILVGITLSCNNTTSTEDSNNTTTKEQKVQAVTLQKVNTDTFKSLMADETIQIVDVRTPEETAAGYIDGAMIGMNFLSGEFEKNLHKLDTARPVAVYCARGGRSAKAAEILKERGFKVVYDYTDGYTGWANQ